MVISGYVFNDIHNNGLYSTGDTPLANSTIELLNSSNVVIGTAVTDANGFYSFSTDNTINTNPTTLTRTATVSAQATDWTQTLNVAQFDPSLGTLTGIDITSAGTFVSDIKVESLDSAPSTITATDSGTLTLTGPAVSGLVTNISTSQSFNATAYDGTLDFGGTSGHDFGPQSAPGSQTITLTSASDLALFLGTGNVSFTEVAHATSSASGAGNLISQITTTANAQLTIVYHYIPSNALKPGNYVLVQTSQPPGYLEGLESSNGVVIPNSVGSDSIPVTLTASSSTGNNFAEIKPASLSGYVYLDSNNNGAKDPGEPGLAGVKITLTGVNDLGPVNLSTMTAGDGSYSFGALRPGLYTITKTPPANYLEGKESLGTLGGVENTDQFAAINVSTGATGINYNFGQLQTGSLSGFVYLDSDNDGIFQYNESGIAGVTVKLTGTNDQGNAISLSQTTGSGGGYSFRNLRPGVYSISIIQPTPYLAGKEGVGSLGGTLETSQIADIQLPEGVSGINYNFGELLPSKPSGQTSASSFVPGSSSFLPLPPLSILSKLQFLSSSSQQLDPGLVAEATYVNGLYHTLLGRGADSTGLTNWVIALQNGVSRQEVATAIWDSAEHRGIEVDQFYAAFLHRSESPAERAAWVNLMLGGESELQVADSFILSSEYEAAHASSTSFVSGLYADVLGRGATSAEITGWTQSLQNGVSRATLASDFLTSSEAYLEILNMAYTDILHRTPDPVGEQSWLAQLNAGSLRPQDISILFLSSGEFYSMAVAASKNA
jgi:protocatechuate 3,4-dioxygenase beta subunit